MTPVFAGWEIYNIPEIREGNGQRAAAVSLNYSKGGSAYHALADALKELKSRGAMHQLTFISPYELTKEPEFQNEIIRAFKKLAPKEWAEAEKSSGNMHNPKMFPLWNHLTKAFQQTSVVEQISRDLEQYDLVITGIIQEKLSYEVWKGKRTIGGVFTIKTGPKKAEVMDVNRP